MRLHAFCEASASPKRYIRWVGKLSMLQTNQRTQQTGPQRYIQTQRKTETELKRQTLPEGRGQQLQISLQNRRHISNSKILTSHTTLGRWSKTQLGRIKTNRSRNMRSLIGENAIFTAKTQAKDHQDLISARIKATAPYSPNTFAEEHKRGGRNLAELSALASTKALSASHKNTSSSDHKIPQGHSRHLPTLTLKPYQQPSQFLQSVSKGCNPLMDFCLSLSQNLDIKSES